MADGNLRNLFKANLPDAHWVPVETWSTGQGVPDAEYCFPGGATGWIENKKTNGWKVDFQPHQVAWIERRVRAGGRVFVAVRRVVPAGPRRGAAVDELWLYPPLEARTLMMDGMQGTPYLGLWVGGPGSWDWQVIRRHLVG